MEKGYRCHYPSPIGTLCMEADEETVTGLYICEEDSCNDRENAVLRQAHKELTEYFSGKRYSFEVPVRFNGTPFQEAVWHALQDIPYGETRTYGEIARAVGNPKACRAVGGANHKNPIMIIIPCHRVIGADGSLVGFGGGLPVKEKLLALEKRTTEGKMETSEDRI